jgi:hypothetical protein
MQNELRNIYKCFFFFFHLGVMKKLQFFYTLNLSNRFFPSKHAVKGTENLFLCIKPFVLVEFSRGPKPFCEVPRFKATGFRQFLRYTGPVVLKPFMKSEHYSFFPLFSLRCIIFQIIICTMLPTRTLPLYINFQKTGKISKYLITRYKI